ncbi:Membrane-fusion protein [Minicystis rosea]|nr:Membrane-fusion protein [Minicystis rosea]
MTTRVRSILFALAVLGMLGLVVRSLAAGPAYDVREKDAVAAQRRVDPPKGAVDERAPLPPVGAVGGAGIVEPAQREARLAGAAPGVIASIAVKEGDRVKEGDVLLTLESSVEVAAVKTAEADVASADATLARTLNGQRSEDRDAALAESASARARAELSETAFARAEQLWKGGAMTQEELDRARHTAAADRQTARAADARARAAQAGSRSEDIIAARAALLSAKARLDQAKATLDRRSIRAPYAGEILQVKARTGEYYTPGASESPVVLGDTSRLRVRMDVDERDIGRIKLGQRAYAVADAFPVEKLTGTVAEIGRRMGRKNVRTDDPTERIDTKILEVVIDLDDAKKLVPGLRVTSYIEAEK